jgi:hypothetical protein
MEQTLSCVTRCEVDQQEQLSRLMRIASESVADNELCRFNALVSALTAGRPMTSHVDMLRPEERQRRRCGVAASLRRRGVAALLRQVHGSQSSRRRGLKSIVKNVTGRRRGLSDWRRVAVARHAPLWSAPGMTRPSAKIETPVSDRLDRSHEMNGGNCPTQELANLKRPPEPAQKSARDHKKTARHHAENSVDPTWFFRHAWKMRQA